MPAITRFAHVGVTVADLARATEFFVALGLEVEGRTFVEGEFIDTVTGIPGARSEIVMLRVPGPDARVELASFSYPDHLPGPPGAPANELGRRSLAFEVDDLDAAGAGAALVKGGHAEGDDSTDIFFDGREKLRLSAPRIATPNTHGTGCTLSAAVAAGLAAGLDLPDAVRAAKAYLHAALAAGATLHVGQGRGPVHHFHRWWDA